MTEIQRTASDAVYSIKMRASKNCDGQDIHISGAKGL